jgi:hypothetical protein
MSIEAAPQTWTRTAKFVGLPLIVFMLVQADGCFPVVRFSNDLANFTVGTFSFVLPFLTMIFAFIVPRRLLTSIVITVLLLPILCFSAAGLLFQGVIASDAFRTGIDPSFERISTVPIGSYSVDVYRTDCGAPCGMGIYLLQKKKLLPGILLVRRLDDFDDAGDATCKEIGQDMLQIDIPAYANDYQPSASIPARSRVYHLKPFLYF